MAKLFDIYRKEAGRYAPIFGYMDIDGNVVLEPQFALTTGGFGAAFSEEGYAVVKRLDAKQHCIIDTQGNTVFEYPENHKPMSLSPPDQDGIFGVYHQVNAQDSSLWRLDGRDMIFEGTTHYYAMRLDGTVAFEAYIRSSAGGYHVVSAGPGTSDKQGLMDSAGRITIPLEADSIYLSRTDPYATVMFEGTVNVLSVEGVRVFESAFNMKNLNNLRAVEDGLWVTPGADKAYADVWNIATVDVVGKIPMTHWSAMIPSACPTLAGGVLCVRDAKKGTTFYRPDGSPALPLASGGARWFAPEMHMGYFSEGMVCFKGGDVWGYMDLNGDTVIEPQFKSDQSFRGGLARVKYPEDGNSWHRFSYVDRQGRVVWHQED